MRINIGNWTRNQRVRAASLAATLLAVVAAGAIGVQTTGAFFTDAHDGNVSGTVGSVRVTTSGGSGADGLNFTFDNLLPGEEQTATAHATNSGNNKQDLWLKFPNATALSALNNLGTYGHVTVVAGSTTLFESTNLNDRSSTCGAFSPTGCWPLPQAVLLKSNLAPGQRVTVKFSFNYASKLTTQPPAGTTAAFNTYPVAGQNTVKAADGTGNGLPFQLVATQHGQTP